MTKLPIVDFRTMEKVLSHAGFESIRQKGSHVFYRHPDGRTTTLPCHKGRDLGRSLIRKVLNEINITTDQYIQMLNQL